MSTTFWIGSLSLFLCLGVQDDWKADELKRMEAGLVRELKSVNSEFAGLKQKYDEHWRKPLHDLMDEELRPTWGSLFP